MLIFIRSEECMYFRSRISGQYHSFAVYTKHNFLNNVWCWNQNSIRKFYIISYSVKKTHYFLKTYNERRCIKASSVTSGNKVADTFMIIRFNNMQFKSVRILNNNLYFVYADCKIRIRTLFPNWVFMSLRGCDLQQTDSSGGGTRGK